MAVATALVGAGSAGADIITPTVEVDTAKVAQTLHAKLGNGNTVGYAFAITEDGRLAATGAGGKARIDKNLAFTANTRMDIASATKNISAAALLKLVEKRGVTLDTKLWGYLPLDLRANMDESWKSLTIKHILGHRSGIAQMLAGLSDADRAKTSTTSDAATGADEEHLHDQAPSVAKTCASSANALNSRAFPAGSSRNMVHCSPACPSNRTYGSMTNSVPAARSRSARSWNAGTVRISPKWGTGTSCPSTGLCTRSARLGARCVTNWWPCRFQSTQVSALRPCSSPSTSP